MDVVVVVGIAVIGAVIAVLLKQYSPEYSLAVSLCACVLIFVIITRNTIPLLSEIQKIVDSTNMPSEYIAILFKALGVCFITDLASNTCQDAGQSAIASKVDLAGKVAILIISMPLFSKVLSIAASLIG